MRRIKPGLRLCGRWSRFAGAAEPVGMRRRARLQAEARAAFVMILACMAGEFSLHTGFDSADSSV